MIESLRKSCVEYCLLKYWQGDESMEKSTVLLEMTGISKIFPGVKALSNVDFKLRAGEVHALMGENGAGKSTLIKVLTGVYERNTGLITIEGEQISVKNPQEAQNIGISTVYQEVNLCPNLSVAENIYIGREPMKHGRIDWKEINNRAKVALSKLNLDIDVTKILNSYSVAIQQMVAIARAVDIKAKVLILDEPTSSLDENEVGKLFDIMKKLKSDGIGIIFVTHFLDQVYQICDRITVLKNGELVGEYEISQLPRYELVSKMLGKEINEFEALENSKQFDKATKKPFIQAKQIARNASINEFNIDLFEGEVLGLAGLLGSGRTEMARLFFGADKIDNGEFIIDGKKSHISSPGDAINREIAFCPEDRKQDGIVGDLSVRDNIILALQTKKGITHKLSRKEQEKIADDYIKLLNIKVSSPEQLMKNLSGGNQQKVILARWLVTQPRLLILDEPTRGIDVGTKAEIQKLVLKLAGEGMSVIFISSELDETVRCCNHVAVLRDRNMIDELYGNDINQTVIMQTIAGGAQ
jgi:galactofuranose transport system ATP-binding protein